MKLTEMFLTEAPIEDFSLVGDWTRNSSFRHEQDRKLLTNPKAQAKIIHKWRKSEVPFNLYFVNSAEANRHTEVGEVTLAWLKGNMPKTLPEITLRDDAVNVIFTNNKGSEREPMTAWVIAHRLGHALARYRIGGTTMTRQVPEFTEIRNELFRYSSMILDGAYSIPNMPDSEARFTRLRDGYADTEKMLASFYTALGTFKSAREDNIRNEFEFLLECLAQYITVGHVRLNPLPQSFKRGRYQRSLSPTGREEYDHWNGMVEELADQMNMLFSHMLHSIVGRTFVM